MSVIPMRNDGTEKQEFELNAVRLLIRSGGLDAGTELLVGSDPPDIVAICGVSTIGIEVRRIYKDETRSGSRDRQRLSAFKNVIDLAAKIHAENSNRFIHVSVHFNSNANIRKAQFEDIANLMVNQVCKLNLDIGQTFNLRSEDLWGPDWPEAVLRISGGCLEGEGPPFWGLSSWSLLCETTDRIIQNALDDKEKNISKWKNNFNESWVLFIIDGSVSSSFMKPHDRMTANVYKSSFDRAFVMEFNGTIFRPLLLQRHEETV